MFKHATATAPLRSAIELDRDYAIKVDLDAAFEGLRPSIAQLLETLRAEARRLAEEQLGRTQAARQECLSWKPSSSQALSQRLAEAE